MRPVITLLIIFILSVSITVKSQTKAITKKGNETSSQIVACDRFWSYTCVGEQTIEREFLANYITIVTTDTFSRKAKRLPESMKKTKELLKVRLNKYKHLISGISVSFVTEDDPLFITLKLNGMDCTTSKHLLKQFSNEDFVKFVSLSTKVGNDLKIEHVMNSCLVYLKSASDIQSLRTFATDIKAEKIRPFANGVDNIFVIEFSKMSKVNPWEFSKLLYKSKQFPAVLTRVITGSISMPEFEPLN